MSFNDEVCEYNYSIYATENFTSEFDVEQCKKKYQDFITACSPINECPSYKDAPLCPTGTLTCSDVDKYCYYPDKDQMVSTYIVPTYDYCPSKKIGNANAGSSFKIADTNVWFRQGGKDTERCKSFK